MKLVISICAFVLFMLSAQAGYSQKEIDVSGKKYLLHKVEKGETTFGICQQFKITPAELIAANPEISTGLKTGASLKIPVKGEVSSEQPKNPSHKHGTSEPEYYYHKVFKNQTIFSIARQYNISANDLVKYNPILTNGLVPGTILKIPVQPDDNKAVASANQKTIADTAPQPAPVKVDEAEFTIHTVAAGETLYRLQNIYGVTLEELTALNPSLANGLKTGTRIKIPVKKQQDGALASAVPVAFNSATIARQDDSTDCKPIVGKNTQKYKVALLLPLYLPGNDQMQPSQLNAESLLGKVDFSKMSNQWYIGSADSVTPSNATVIDPKAENFLEFYEGALLAIDSLQQQGMNVELCVFDASNLNLINALLQLDVFRELDLIIGPVYPELQETVASFAAKNRIPMVSPLAYTGSFEENNPYYFKVNPTRDYQVEQSAKYIASEFKAKNFTLLKMNGNNGSTEAKVANLGSEMLLDAKQQDGDAVTYHEYSFQQQGLHGIKSLLDNTAENIFMIPTDNEAQVSVAVTNLNALAEHYNVVLMGTSNFPKMKSIQTENYHRVQLRYLASTFVDYNQPLVRRFISNYRGIFSAEPTQFSYQGYDVSYYFLSALYRYGKNFRNCLPEYPMKLTQNNFNFRRVTPMGGYMNHSLYVTSYKRNFDISNLGIVASETK